MLHTIRYITNASRQSKMLEKQDKKIPSFMLLLLSNMY